VECASLRFVSELPLLTRDAGWPFDQHPCQCASCLNIACPVWKDMLVTKVAITASANVERASLSEVGVQSKSPGLLAWASG
jgi:hypothetical protein